MRASDSSGCTPAAWRCARSRSASAARRRREGGSAEEIRTPGLDRLLWLFLRLLLSKTALDRFLQTMSSEEIAARLEQLRKDFAAAQQAGDERIVKSLQDSIAMAELRLDNYERAKKNAQFVSIELDRIEGKIQALAEMAVNRQDPDLPEQPGRLGGREHAADRESGERAAAPDRPRRRTAGAAGDPRVRLAPGAAPMTPELVPGADAPEERQPGRRAGGAAAMVPALGRPARRALFFGNDVGVRASRQHLRLRAHRRLARSDAVRRRSRSSWPSSSSAAGRWSCTTTSAAGCACWRGATSSG